MKVLDSDFLIAVLRKDAEVKNKLNHLSSSGEPIYTTIFDAQEVLFGALQSKNAKNIDATLKLLKSINIIAYDLEGMHHSVEITRFLEERGERIGIFDEMIAGICVAYNASLITRNIKHFSRIGILNIDKW